MLVEKARVSRYTARLPPIAMFWLFLSWARSIPGCYWASRRPSTFASCRACWLVSGYGGVMGLGIAGRSCAGGSLIGATGVAAQHQPGLHEYGGGEAAGLTRRRGQPGAGEVGSP